MELRSGRVLEDVFSLSTSCMNADLENDLKTLFRFLYYYLNRTEAQLLIPKETKIDDHFWLNYGPLSLENINLLFPISHMEALLLHLLQLEYKLYPGDPLFCHLQTVLKRYFTELYASSPNRLVDLMHEEDLLHKRSTIVRDKQLYLMALAKFFCDFNCYTHPEERWPLSDIPWDIVVQEGQNRLCFYEDSDGVGYTIERFGFDSPYSRPYFYYHVLETGKKFTSAVDNALKAFHLHRRCAEIKPTIGTF